MKSRKEKRKKKEKRKGKRNSLRYKIFNVSTNTCYLQS